MIDIRRKRQAFHQTIRMSQRETLRKIKRQNLAIQQQHQEFLNALNQPFSFCENWEEEKYHFWKNGPSNQSIYYTSHFHFLQQTSQTLKNLLLQFQSDPDAKLDISYHLIDNLPFLVPPSHLNLDQLPKTFIELCMFILKNPHHDDCDKENFIYALPHETIVRCLLKYFAQNWAEIKTNKCNDIIMNFFFEFNKYKNIFTQFMYNDQNLEFLLEESIKEILNLTQAEINFYNSWATSRIEFKNQDFDNFQDRNLSRLAQMEYSQEEKVFQVMKQTTFLCNILLLSPTPNFNIKQVRNQLKTIAFYLHRKILLNQYDSKFQISAEFCVSTLLAFTCQVHMDKQIQIMTKILKNQIQRIKQQKYRLNKVKNTNYEVEIDRKVPTKEENLEGQDIIEKDEDTFCLLNRISLLMISNMAQDSTHLRYRHVQNWLNYQMRLKEKNLFKIQDSEVMRCLLSLLRKFIKNEQNYPETYKSYSYDRVFTNERYEQVFRIKASICKLIDGKGFELLLKSKGIKEYNKEFCSLLCSLMDGMDEFGDVSSMVLSLFKFNNSQNQPNMDILCESGGPKEEMEQMDQEYEDGQNNVLLAIRAFILKLSGQFLETTYKYLPYKEKEQLMLHLVNSDYLDEEETAKYLTQEERLKFKKQFHFTWDNYSDEDQLFDHETFQQSQQTPGQQSPEYKTENTLKWTQRGMSKFRNLQQTQI